MDAVDLSNLSDSDDHVDLSASESNVTDLKGGYDDKTSKQKNKSGKATKKNKKSEKSKKRDQEGKKGGGPKDIDDENGFVRGLIPDAISPCGFMNEKGKGDPNAVCSSTEVVQKIAGKLNIDASLNEKEIIDKAKTATKCETEKCVSRKLAIPQGIEVFKIDGPTDGTWLNNFNIEGVLKQFQVRYPNFYAYNFNMRNYSDYSFVDGDIINKPDSLAYITYEYLRENNFNCTACVINSDTYQGKGEHWMALFIDARSDQPTVEFFNSSGRPPALEWCNWLRKMQNEIDAFNSSNTNSSNKHPDQTNQYPNQTNQYPNQANNQHQKAQQAKIIKVCDVKHQKSTSECGLYSLFYICARLNGISYEKFKYKPIHDKFMFEFRSHLFEDEFNKGLKKFDWDAYQKTAKVKWE